MEKLPYSYDVFESGAGRIHSILVKASLPSLILGVLLMGVINSGLFTGFAGLPGFVKILFIAAFMEIEIIEELLCYGGKAVRRISQDFRSDYQQQG